MLESLREVELVLSGLLAGFEVGEFGVFGGSKNGTAASLIPICMVEVRGKSVCGTEVYPLCEMCPRARAILDLRLLRA